MINAIVQNEHGKITVIDLTAHYHEIYKELQTIDYYSSLEHLLLRDEECEAYRVKLYSDSDIGNHMILLLDERDSLYDAYELDLAVTNAREEIKDDLEQNILHGQYSNVTDVIEGINQLKMNVAKSKVTFYCPLMTLLDEGEDYYPTTQDYILDHRDDIEEMLFTEQMPDLGDMAEYLGNHSEIGQKIIYAVWRVDAIDDELYGKIDCYFTETPNAEETAKLRSAVRGQNSDGFGEGFEQRPIKTEDGDMYVSFWNSSDDYFLYTQSEMDDYISNGHKKLTEEQNENMDEDNAPIMGM